MIRRDPSTAACKRHGPYGDGDDACTPTLWQQHVALKEHVARLDRIIEELDLTEIAEELASALHHHNIGQDIRGWREVSEAFALVKDVLDATDLSNEAPAGY